MRSGLVADRFVVLVILQPLIAGDLGLGPQLELWLRGAETRLGNGELVVARTT